MVIVLFRESKGQGILHVCVIKWRFFLSTQFTHALLYANPSDDKLCHVDCHGTWTAEVYVELKI